jgi:hypothetical protein
MSMGTVRIAMVGMAAAAAGCFGSSAGVDVPDGGEVARDAALPQPDGSANDAGGDGGTGTDAGSPLPATEPRGSVRIQAGDFGTEVAARFIPEPEVSCDRERHGACQLWRCDSVPSPAEREEVSAGDITVTTPGLGETVLEPSSSRGTSLYDRAIDGDPNGVQPGDSIEVSAQGDVVPRFEANVVFPEGVEMDFGEVQPQRVPAEEPLEFTWRGGNEGSELVVSLARGSAVRARCLFDASEGRAALPSPVLQAVGEQQQPTALDVSVQDRSRLETGEFTVDVRAVGIGQASVQNGSLSLVIE